MAAKRNSTGAETSSPSKRRKPNMHLQSEGSAVPTSTNPPPAATSHVRFGSEEPREPLQKLSPPSYESEDISENATDREHSVEDSDDEAPEAVTASEAQASTKAAAQRASRALERDRSEAKKRRKAQDERLKKQASTPSRHIARPEEDDEDDDESDTNHSVEAVPAARGDTEIPDLLPEDILEDGPYVRPPTPEPEPKGVEKQGQRARRIIKFDSEPKDRQVGPVKVSVLKKLNRHLPPKVNRQSASIRESWLAGRQGRNGQSTERKKVNAGFLKS